MIGPFFVALLSIKYGEGGWTRFDKLCLAGAGIGTLLWWLTSSSEIGLVSYLFVDFMAVMPTIRKSIYRSENENRTAWALTFSGQFLNLFAVERLVYSILIYPVYMIITNSIIFGLQFKKKGDKAFSSVDIVSQCLVDTARTGLFQKAISEKVKEGDKVIEVGTGSGIMSLFAAKAGARKVISLEFDSFISKIATGVIKANNYQDIVEVRTANGNNYEFEPGLKFDVVIMEMLTTGMVDEHQISAINNLHRRRVINGKTIFIPYKQDTFATLGNFNFNCYGFNVLFIRHLWKFQEPETKQFRALTNKVILSSIDFSSINPEKFENTLSFIAREDGVVNCVHLSSISHLAKDLTLIDTNSINGPVVIPIESLSVKTGQEIILSICYTFGMGYENVKITINH